MQTGLGLNDLSDEDLQNQINQLYYMYNDKGDFSHMCYTLSGCINNDWGGVDNRWRKGHTEGWGALNDYYEDMANSGDSDFRGKEFLQNNSYETVEEAILDKLDISLEDLKSNKDYSDTVEFLERLKDLCEELR